MTSRAAQLLRSTRTHFQKPHGHRNGLLSVWVFCVQRQTLSNGPSILQSFSLSLSLSLSLSPSPFPPKDDNRLHFRNSYYKKHKMMDHVHIWAPSSAHNVRCLDTNKALKTYITIRFAAEGITILVFREGKVSDKFLKPGNKISEVLSVANNNSIESFLSTRISSRGMTLGLLVGRHFPQQRTAAHMMNGIALFKYLLI